MSDCPLSEDDEDFIDFPEAYPDLFDKSGNRKIDKILAPVRKSARQNLSDTREHLHLMLDAILNLKEAGDGHGYALHLSNQIVRGAMKWIQDGPTLQLRLKRRIGKTADPDKLYEPMAICEALAIWPFLPHDMKGYLDQALRNLDWSTRPLHPLFQRASSPTNLELAQDAEERMWRWIFYQRGQGKTSDEAVRQVADVVGRSESAVRAWRSEWRERDGDDFVNAALSTARRLGKKVAAGLWEFDWLRKSVPVEREVAVTDAETSSDAPSGLCELIYLFSDEKGLLDSDREMFDRYEEEVHVFSEYPDEPLKTLSRIWKRTRALPPHEESGPIQKDDSASRVQLS